MHRPFLAFRMTGLGLIESPVRVDMTLSPNWRERQEQPLAPSGETYSIVDVGAWPSTLNRQRSSRWNGLEFLAHSGGVVAGARRCFVPCSYLYPISIKIFSDHGLPRNSIPMGTPSTAVGVGGETPWHHNRREPSYRSEGTVTFRLRLGYRGIVSEVDCFCSLGSITLARYRQGVAMLP